MERGGLRWWELGNQAMHPVLLSLDRLNEIACTDTACFSSQPQGLGSQ